MLSGRWDQGWVTLSPTGQSCHSFATTIVIVIIVIIVVIFVIIFIAIIIIVFILNAKVSTVNSLSPLVIRFAQLYNLQLYRKD